MLPVGAILIGGDETIPMSDMLFGAIGLIIFLAVVFAAGFVFYKFQNARMAGKWGPLVGLVNGKVVGDGGGGATSWLMGTYKGRKVQAATTPNRNVYSSTGDMDSSNARYNDFEVALADERGRHDWNITYDRKFLGMGQEGWRVQSADPSVQSALDAAGVVSLVAPFGIPTSHISLPVIEFNRREELLRYRYDAGSSWTPPPQVFMEHLEMLLRLADVNTRVNTP